MCTPVLSRGCLVLTLTVGLSAIGCGKGPAQQAGPLGTHPWLKGELDQRLDQLSKHHRGFDMAMVETGYRYTELYYAGKELNWDYAKYQADKIKTTIENGFERRPARRANAETLFLSGPYKDVVEAIAEKNSARFNATFQLLTDACNRCHQAENMGYIHVELPRMRSAPVGPKMP